jgi:2-polyprenyl-3-methyl-5-hydroxy-6-metoxy-1,4-benzoquinol methylase
MEENQKNKILAIVKNNYQEIAADFDSTRKKYTWPELNKIVSATTDGMSVLDVGCGNGRLLESFVGKKINYLGVDASSNLIELAKKNYPDHKFLVCDILNLDNLKSQNDLVCSIAVIHHLPSFELRLAALKQLIDATKDQGQIVFSVWNLWQNKKYRSLLLKSVWKKIIGVNKLDFGDLIFPWKNNLGQAVSERYYHAFTRLELKNLLKKASVKNYHLYKDARNYWVIINK